MENPIQNYTPGSTFAVAQSLADTLSVKTPKKFIERRPDGFDYVQVGYIRRRLTEAFGLSWSFNTDPIMSVEEMLKTGHCVVKGVLTVVNPKTGEPIIVREQYGGAPIKKKRSGEIMDLANDLKGAGSDALKKCASQLGIAQDVYEPKVESKGSVSSAEAPLSEDTPASGSQRPEPQEKPSKAPSRSIQSGPGKITLDAVAAIRQLAQRNGVGNQLEKFILKSFNTKLVSRLSWDQHKIVMDWLHKQDLKEPSF